MDFQRVRPTAPRSFGPNQAPASMSAPPPPPAAAAPELGTTPVSRSIPITFNENVEPPTEQQPLSYKMDSLPSVAEAPAEEPQAPTLEPTNEVKPPEDTSNKPDKTKRHLKIKFSRIQMLVVILLLALTAGVYAWQHQQYSNAKVQAADSIARSNNLNKLLTDHINAAASLPNIIDPTSAGSQDLLAFLAASNSGCFKQANSGKGWYKVNKEFNGNQAEVQYGCQNTYLVGTPSLELVTKASASGQWKIINPVSEWLAVSGVQYPVCGMVNDNKISKQLEPKCAVQTTVNNLPTVQLQDVTNP